MRSLKSLVFGLVVPFLACAPMDTDVRETADVSVEGIEQALVDSSVRVREHCDSASSPIQAPIQGTGCFAITGSGPSYIDLPRGVEAKLFTSSNCTGYVQTTVGGSANLCSVQFSDGSGANDRVRSIYLASKSRSSQEPNSVSKVGLITTRANGRCMDWSGGVTWDHNPVVHLWDCWGGENQNWVHYTDGTLRNPMSQYCLTWDDSGVASNGSQVRISSCSGARNQKWEVRSNGDIITWANATPGTQIPVARCLDINGPELNNLGAKIQLWDCNGTNNQKWNVEGTLRGGDPNNRRSNSEYDGFTYWPSIADKYFDYACPPPGTDGCSVPGLVSDSTTEYYKKVFLPACVRHDYCYSAPWEAAGRGDGKARCDDQFFADMLSICTTEPNLLCAATAGAWATAVNVAGKLNDSSECVVGGVSPTGCSRTELEVRADGESFMAVSDSTYGYGGCVGSPRGNFALSVARDGSVELHRGWSTAHSEGLWARSSAAGVDNYFLILQGDQLALYRGETPGRNRGFVRGWGYGKVKNPRKLVVTDDGEVLIVGTNVVRVDL